MKVKTLISGIALLSIGAVTMTLGSCNKQADLSTEEIADLEYLREEEKLARDVYLYAFDLYGDAVFQSISASEQKHMDKILVLLNDYDIEDPASTERGVFNNVELQHLYNSLIAKTDSSLLDAFIVGATIEDVDIFDIDEFIMRTDQEDILDAYEKLECGSNNHMRKFIEKLIELDYDYIPQFISVEQFNTILAEESGGCGG
ncbi:MAG: DUF2202 domain-containing protein [Crocinitomix sp.]|nr:DUF2202 domain-containing protein [Crocinitomix sp.]